MPRQARRLAESGIYHVMLRGVNRDLIFLDDKDYRRFLDALALTRDASGCRILGYCLMPNHVHLIIRTGDEPIGAVVKRLGVRYAGSFNRRYGRVGHLFQDRFASRPVETDSYLTTLTRYLWANPVEAGLVERGSDYPWSSRHVVGTTSSLVDGEHLESLLPPGTLDALLHEHPSDIPTWDGLSESAGRISNSESAALFFSSSGASGPDGFSLLPPSERQRVVRELRIRGVSYAQLSRLTGLSKTQVRRLHIASDPGDAA